MLLETLCTDLERARATNSTNSAFSVSRVLPSITQPLVTGQVASATTPQFFDISGNKSSGLGDVGQNAFKIIPYGVGSNTNTFSFRAFGWRRHKHVDPQNGYVPLWLPEFFGEWLCTLDSSIPGVTGAIVDSTNYFCSTVALTNPAAATSGMLLMNPGTTGLIGSVLIDFQGCKIGQLEFSTGSSATNANALICSM
jgi:hypothetical protein